MLMSIYLFYSNEHGVGLNDADTIRYATSGGKSNTSTDTKIMESVFQDNPMQNYEDVGVDVPANPLPIPPKPQAKRPLKKPAVTSTAKPSHARSGHQGPYQPVPTMRPSQQSQYQSRVQPPPIYESPD